MNKIKSLEPSWKTSVHYSKLDRADSVLLNGRKWILLGSCCLPAISLVNITICSVIKISVLVLGLMAVVAHSLFEKFENPTGKAICNKIIAYGFASTPGLALSLELLDVVSPLIAVVCGVAISMIFSVGMYKIIER